MPFYTPQDFSPHRSIGYLTKRSHKLFVAIAEPRLVDLGLSFSEWVTLALLQNGMADTCAGVARELGHNSGATTRLVDGLEGRGLLRRQRDQGDRRVQTLSLTEAGADIGTRATTRLMEFWNELLADFTRDEAAQLISLLGRLVALLEDKSRTEFGR